MIIKNNALCLLTLLKILFLETSEKHPLTKKALLKRMEEEGFPIHSHTFHKYLAAMRDNEITILFDNKLKRGYYYAAGWIDGTDVEQM